MAVRNIPELRGMCSDRGKKDENNEAGGDKENGEQQEKEKTFQDAAVEFNAVIQQYPVPSFVT